MERTQSAISVRCTAARRASGTPSGRATTTATERLYHQLTQRSPMEQAAVLRPYTRWLLEQRRVWNLPAFRTPNDVFSPFAQISQQPPEFEFPRRDLPPHFHFAGPFQVSRARAPVQFPFEALDGRPLVYASLGTLQNRLSWI